MFDFLRLGAAVPTITVGDPEQNAQQICQKIQEATDVSLLVFPELCVSGYTCGDLFFQTALQNSVKEAIVHITKQTEDFAGIVLIGAPIMIEGNCYNCGLVLSKGTLWGVIPKTFLPNYNEFYEERWFCSASELMTKEISPRELGLDQEIPVPIGNDLVFDTGLFRFGVEICEDLWSPLPPSTMLALSGAEIIVNLSASNELVTKRDYRRGLVSGHSAQELCTYLFVSAGGGESTTDLVFSGHSMGVENGVVLLDTSPEKNTDYLARFDTDLGKIRAERQKTTSFSQTGRIYGLPCRRILMVHQDLNCDGWLYPVNKHPFVPSDETNRAKRCLDIFRMQSEALSKRLSITGGKMVLGVSGGLDSTLALLVCAQTARQMEGAEVCGITMPCFGTTDRTYQNALQLMKALGVTPLEISILESVTQHFKDIGHDPQNKDTTYENAQARERTQVLMDVANQKGAIVVGTGDLSELALGWCTYNGDHMSMYGVNAGIPKTLLKWIIKSILDEQYFPDANPVLQDILDTPISPELLPPDPTGEISQKTEDLVGPYELHDFFLYQMLRFGFTPTKIFTLACWAFEGDYDKETILHWLTTFYRRFFSQQFKRSCMPDGVKIGSVSLSPRGDWRMPSDASSAVWLKELSSIKL